ncbi:hypothetical protein I3843_05G182200 [Carya illinoinensis]|nr:hypothetical protein I3843_05G182200 [Carya illinoinensis]KAG7980438.1 hypothetical protein I3843_05G182200 [Carya illinoinensis]
MSQQRQNKMVVTNNGDTTYTKIFVGGLAWETQRDTLKRYFEQFGEILEAVVIIEKNTGRSRGYGFVTFKDPDSAKRACQNHYPVIDGRRANCNLAVLGARNNYPSTPQRGMEKSGSSFRTMAPVPFHGTSTYFHHHIPQYAFPYSTYGCPDYQQDMFAMNYYNVYGGQHVPSSYCFMPTGPPEVYDYSRITQPPYFLSQQYRALGGLQVPTSVSPTNSTATAKLATGSIAAAGVPGTASDQQNSSA